MRPLRDATFFQAEDGIRDRSPSRGLGDVYKRQGVNGIQESLAIQVQNSDIESYIKNKTCIVINEFFDEYTEKKFDVIKKNLNISQEEILLVDKIDKEKMKEMTKKNHSMAHSHSNSILLEPNKKAELIWKFNTDTNLEAACNVPGHYEAGMISKINKI